MPVQNWGASGATSSAYLAGQAWRTVSPLFASNDCVVISFGINDVQRGVSPATYASNVTQTEIGPVTIVAHVASHELKNGTATAAMAIMKDGTAAIIYEAGGDWNGYLDADIDDEKIIHDKWIVDLLDAALASPIIVAYAKLNDYNDTEIHWYHEWAATMSARLDAVANRGKSDAVDDDES